MSTYYTFSVEHAEKYGLNEAIMLHNFIYWLNINRANNHNYIDGRHWTYNSAKAFQNLFPFWTQKQIQYLLSKMVDYGILLQGCFNKDKRDRTSWYTLSDEFFSDCILQNREMDTTKSGNDILQNREMIYITDKKQQIKNTNENNINTASGFSQSDFLENFIKERLSKMSESEKAGYYAFTVTQLESLAEKLGRPLTQMECQEKCKMVLDNMYLEDENPVVKDSLITQNPTAMESLTVQKPKKEEEFEQFWLQWKDLCKNKGSQTGGKKPAKIEYEKVLKKVKQEDIIRVLNAFNNYIQIAFANNKHCERWIKSENWDNIDEAIADYKQQEENIKKQLIKEGKPVPLPQKTPLEAQREVVDTNALLELRNAKYNALTQKQRDTSDSICTHLLTYFGEIHHEWIKSSIWFQQNLENDEIDLHIRIFSENTKKTIERNYDKIRDKVKKLDGKTVKEIIIKVVKN